MMRATGVQTTTNSASATPLARSMVVWLTAPTRRAIRRLTWLRPMPTIASARPRWRRARPIEPPISPTPTIATFPRCFIACPASGCGTQTPYCSREGAGGQGPGGEPRGLSKMGTGSVASETVRP